MVRNVGSLKSPVDPRDWIYENLAKGYSSPVINDNDELPEEFHLIEHTQPSRDQGKRGTCSAFTAAMIKEIQENRESGFDEHMSPEFIYYHRENKPANGMYGRNVFQILQKVGSVPEKSFPYLEHDNANKPSKHVYKEASQYRISNYARVTTILGLKHALIELGPCYILLPLYATRPHFWRTNNPNVKYPGGHSTTVIGFNKEGFILKNSWGYDWNDNGCIIFPYEDWDIHWECWVPIKNKIKKFVVKPKRIIDNNVVNNNNNTVDNEQRRFRKPTFCTIL